MCEQWFNLISSTIRLHVGSFFDGDISFTHFIAGESNSSLAVGSYIPLSLDGYLRGDFKCEMG